MFFNYVWYCTLEEYKMKSRSLTAEFLKYCCIVVDQIAHVQKLNYFDLPASCMKCDLQIFLMQQMQNTNIRPAI